MRAPRHLGHPAYSAAMWLMPALLLACGDTPSALPDDVADLADVGDGADNAPDEPNADLGDPDADLEGSAIAISGLVVVENPANSLSYFVEWETDLPADTRLEVVCGDEVNTRISSPELTTEHSVFVMGLLDGLGCDLTASSQTETRSGSRAARIEAAGPLPEFLPALEPSVLDADRVEPGWTLWTMGQATGRGPVYLILTDELGRYRWFYQESPDRPGSDNEVQIIDGGLLLGGGTTKIVSWEGEVLWEPPFSSHHDVRLSPFDAGHLLYLGKSSEGCETTEGTANDFDMTDGQTVWTWRICEHFTPRMEYGNWSHINTIEPVPGERAVVLSPRDQNALLKVDRDTGEIIWVLGDNGDFEREPEARFLRQHAPEIQPNGNILIFDNGLAEWEALERGDGLPCVRPYSRVIELALTFTDTGEPDRAEVVWDYTDTSLFSASRGEADRLANGNTLITYSRLEEDLSSLLLEVTPEGEIVWSLRDPPNRQTYRSERVDLVFGYVRSQP